MLSAFAVAALGCFGGSDGTVAASTQTSLGFLNQNWTPADRERFYRTAQGSQLIPFDWFLAIEKRGDQSLFRDAANMDRLRFLPQSPTSWNPNGLPVGFVVDADLDDSQTRSKAMFLAQRKFRKSERSLEKKWLGFTCAACHTTRLEYGGTTLQIDGAPSMADFQGFLVELAEAVDATHRDDEKFRRFAERVSRGVESETLRSEVADYSKALESLVKRNDSALRYGFGRLDAFGAILNAICDAGLDLPANRVEPNAPTSYPFLWNAPHHSWVQWNNTANIALTRNVGEVLGVFGFFTLKDSGDRNRFDSTVRLKGLVELENVITTLKAPVWPENVFGKIDVEKAKKGRTLFARNCASCHQLRDAAGRFKTMADGRRVVQESTPWEIVQTDRAFLDNFNRDADPGVLRDLLPDSFRQLPRVPRPILLRSAVLGVLKNRAQAESIPVNPDPALLAEKPPLLGQGFASRPLEGVWATAPFLHNGSVPSLYELLLPSSRRSRSFFVGSRRFDPVRVGFETAPIAGGFEFITEIFGCGLHGNSNRGHEGHGREKNEGFTELFENGEWREFTEGERWELVEFVKSIGLPLDPRAPDADARRYEAIPPQEAEQIKHIVELTGKQLENRYGGGKKVLRGVHPKDHGCVKATVDILPNLDAKYRIGPFAEPGRRYEALVRFSNAEPRVLDDNKIDRRTNQRIFGSRGMAIKLLDVAGEQLISSSSNRVQDFVMVNHPVFAFANVEDYEVLSEVLADPANAEEADKFFAIQLQKGGPAAARAKNTLGIIGKIRAPNVAAGGYQPQPASPVDCAYHSAAPFKFGAGAVAKFAAFPLDPPSDPKPAVDQPSYLREALKVRLAAGSKSVVFEIKVQRRELASVDLATDIEDACTLWNDPFVTVARMTIEPQDFDSEARRAECERLIFTPWQGVADLRPLGGINRMRRAVYEASSSARGAK